MEKLKEFVALGIFLIGILGVPFFIWYYETVYIPSQYQPNARIIRLTGDFRGAWTTERITGYNYWWKTFPAAKIRVHEGDPVVLRVTSADVYHGFGMRISGQRINEKVSPGQMTTIEFTANEAGLYRFVCTLSCGESHVKMRGNLVVEEKIAV